MSFVLSWDLDACVGVVPWWSSTLENIVLPALDLLVAMMSDRRKICFLNQAFA